MKTINLPLAPLFLFFFISHVMSSFSGCPANVALEILDRIELEKLKAYNPDDPFSLLPFRPYFSHLISEQKDLSRSTFVAICIGDTISRNILCEYLFEGQDVHAPEMSDADLVKLVLDKIEDVNYSDGWGRTPLEYAAEYGRMDLVEIILPKAKAESTECTYWGTPIELALQNGHVAVAERLWQWIKNGNPELLRGNSLLHLAVKEGSLETVSNLLSKTAHVNEANEDEDTPLTLAERNGRGDVADLIREKIRSACDAAN